jgi:8-oxo-dGTP diphosphatase
MNPRVVSIPQKNPIQRTVRAVVAALILREQQVLICQRRPGQPMEMQWEFPGGKIEPGETPEQAIHRELQEELGIEATIGPCVATVRHNYRNGGAVHLQFFTVHEYQGTLENKIFNDVRWSSLQDLPRYDFLAADKKFVVDLAQGKIL